VAPPPLEGVKSGHSRATKLFLGHVTDQAILIAASCTTGWADGEHGNLWLAPDGIARIPLGWAVSFAHTFQGVDPARWLRSSITVDDLTSARNSARRSLWLPAADIEAAWLHRGLLNDRLRLRMRGGAAKKLLWVRHKTGTDLLKESLRAWIGEQLSLD
jgi:hypothetical protein